MTASWKYGRITISLEQTEAAKAPESDGWHVRWVDAIGERTEKVADETAAMAKLDEAGLAGWEVVAVAERQDRRFHSASGEYQWDERLNSNVATAIMTNVSSATYTLKRRVDS